MANAISLDSLNSAIQDKKEELTQAQFDEYLSTIEGIEVNWRGKVSDVKVIERSDNDKSKEKIYRLHLVDMVVVDGSNMIIFSPLRVRLNSLDKATALSLNKNQEYNISGKIKDVSRRTEYLTDDFTNKAYIYGFIVNLTVSK